MKRAALVVVALAAASAAALAFAAGPKPPPLPYPIPGYLLIADRGNNRMLLVDSNKHILWSYPRPGQGTSFPFRFDDDTFFGPGLKTIISNQEGQHTIQIISFPG